MKKLIFLIALFPMLSHAFETIRGESARSIYFSAEGPFEVITTGLSTEYLDIGHIRCVQQNGSLEWNCEAKDLVARDYPTLKMSSFKSKIMAETLIKNGVEKHWEQNSFTIDVSRMICRLNDDGGFSTILFR